MGFKYYEIIKYFSDGTQIKTLNKGNVNIEDIFFEANLEKIDITNKVDIGKVEKTKHKIYYVGTEIKLIDKNIKCIIPKSYEKYSIESFNRFIKANSGNIYATELWGVEVLNPSMIVDGKYIEKKELV